MIKGKKRLKLFNLDDFVCKLKKKRPKRRTGGCWDMSWHHLKKLSLAQLRQQLAGLR